MRAESKAIEQIMGRVGAGPAAAVLNRLALGPDRCARRVGRAVGPKRHADEHHERYECQGAQVELATAVFELHAGSDDGRAGRRAKDNGRDQSVVQGASDSTWARPCPTSNP